MSSFSIPRPTVKGGGTLLARPKPGSPYNPQGATNANSGAEFSGSDGTIQHTGYTLEPSTFDKIIKGLAIGGVGVGFGAGAGALGSSLFPETAASLGLGGGGAGAASASGVGAGADLAATNAAIAAGVPESTVITGALAPSLGGAAAAGGATGAGSALASALAQPEQVMIQAPKPQEPPPPFVPYTPPPGEQVTIQAPKPQQTSNGGADIGAALSNLLLQPPAPSPVAVEPSPSGPTTPTSNVPALVGAGAGLTAAGLPSLPLTMPATSSLPANGALSRLSLRPPPGLSQAFLSSLGRSPSFPIGRGSILSRARQTH